MLQKTITITTQNGLHIRPAAILVNHAQKFTSDITITFKDKTINAKSLFKLQTLGLIKNSQIVLSASGPDEQDAIQKLSKVIQNLK
ncbi:HPr family phosphocarrier protein [Buchnera aphidicola]|uniref:Phosphocarrier protein HPr n=1 Tax=Buchnera aphidicola (Stegophylla sp.) TaxID=2315800 RepID=A0A4D6Y992_9GAMM|nr:HPr family phosphocarrier protein [Buchnera aphidicola (Stegophylla sp.)]QCI26247.1 HPr family phosphocarrier protein [Buchnera aphidicola (Stegophylla sp.)]